MSPECRVVAGQRLLRRHPTACPPRLSLLTEIRVGMYHANLQCPSATAPPGDLCFGQLYRPVRHSDGRAGGTRPPGGRRRVSVIMKPRLPRKLSRDMRRRDSAIMTASMITEPARVRPPPGPARQGGHDVSGIGSCPHADPPEALHEASPAGEASADWATVTPSNSLKN